MIARRYSNSRKIVESLGTLALLRDRNDACRSCLATVLLAKVWTLPRHFLFCPGHDRLQDLQVCIPAGPSWRSHLHEALRVGPPFGDSRQHPPQLFNTANFKLQHRMWGVSEGAFLWFQFSLMKQRLNPFVYTGRMYLTTLFRIFFTLSHRNSLCQAFIQSLIALGTEISGIRSLHRAFHPCCAHLPGDLAWSVTGLSWCEFSIYLILPYIHARTYSSPFSCAHPEPPTDRPFFKILPHTLTSTPLSRSRSHSLLSPCLLHPS